MNKRTIASSTVSMHQVTDPIHTNFRLYIQGLHWLYWRQPIVSPYIQRVALADSFDESFVKCVTTMQNGVPGVTWPFPSNCCQEITTGKIFSFDHTAAQKFRSCDEAPTLFTQHRLVEHLHVHQADVKCLLQSSNPSYRSGLILCSVIPLVCVHCPPFVLSHPHTLNPSLFSKMYLLDWNPSPFDSVDQNLVEIAVENMVVPCLLPQA